MAANTLYSIDHAHEIANTNNEAEEDGWKYEVEIVNAEKDYAKRVKNGDPRLREANA